MTRLFSRLPLRGRLILIALVAVVPALAVIGYTQALERQSVLDGILGENRRLAVLAANQQAAVFGGVVRLLSTLAEFPGLNAHDPHTCDELLPNILRGHPAYVNLSVAEGSDNGFCTARPLLTPRSPRTGLWFKETLEKGTTAIGEYQLSATNSEPAVLIAHPVLGPSGRPERLVAAMIGLGQLNELAARAKLPPGATLTLFDHSGTILARYPESERWIGHRLPEALTSKFGAIAEVAGPIDAIGEDGARRLFIAAPVQTELGAKLSVAIGVDPALAFAAADNALRQELWLLILVTLSTVLVAWFGGEAFVVRPLRALEDLARRLAGGEFSARARVAHGVLGLHEMGSAVNQMAATLETRERDLRASEDRYRHLFDENPHPMWVYELSTLKFVEVNDAALRHYEYTREEFLAMRITDIRPPEEVSGLLLHLAKERPLWEHTSGWRHRKRSGQIIDVDITSHEITLGQQQCALVIAQDVTDRVRAEHALAERTAMSALLADVTGALNKRVSLRDSLQACTSALAGQEDVAAAYVWTVTDAGDALEMRASSGSTSGFERSHRRLRLDRQAFTGTLSAPQRGTTDAAPSPDVPWREWTAAEGLAGMVSFPLVVHERLVGLLAVSAKAPSEAKTSTLALVANDLALGIERQQSEQSLRKSEERLRLIAEKITEVFWISDVPSSSLVYVSPAYEGIWGRTCESLYQGTMTFLDTIHAEDRDQVVATLKCQQKGLPFDHEYRIVRPDGGVRWIWDRGFPVAGAGGRATQYVGVAQDVTERRLLEEQLRQAQKLEAIGQLAGGIAHDFNNLLTAIQGYAQFLADELAEEDPRRADADEILRAGNRAAALTQQLLAFSRKQVLNPRVVRPADVIADLAPMLRRLVGETIEFRTVTADLGCVKADVGQLQQVLVNLVVNARDAMRHGGTLTVSSTDVTIPAGSTHGSLAPGKYVRVTVSDTGCGMDRATRARIFEPFFTTKPTGEGTGLGLSTVYGIVEQSGGSIDVVSAPGQGSTFTVDLPCTQEPAVAGVHTASGPGQRGQETLVIVEDDDNIRELIAKTLGRRGYTVRAFSRPSLAVEYSVQEQTTIDLLLTDVMLPEMTGNVLATVITKNHPETQVLFMSGYADGVLTRQGVLDPDTAFMQKPFTPTELANKVRQLLDSVEHTESHPKLGINVH